jgi:hypothetical protein
MVVQSGMLFQALFFGPPACCLEGASAPFLRCVRKVELTEALASGRTFLDYDLYGANSGTCG